MRATFRITPHTATQVCEAMIGFVGDPMVRVVEGADYVSYETCLENLWTVEFVSPFECYLHYAGSRAGLTAGCAGWGRLRRRNDRFCTVDISANPATRAWYIPGWTRQGIAMLVWWESTIPTNPSPLDRNWRQALADELHLQRLEELEDLAGWREAPMKRRLGAKAWR